MARSLVLIGLLCGISIACSRERPVPTDEQLFAEARAARDAGDKQKALELYGQSINTRPTTWAYVERARLHAELGNKEAAATDVQKGLEMAPEHPDLQWMQAELKKPAGEQFKGKSAAPPSASK